MGRLLQWLGAMSAFGLAVLAAEPAAAADWTITLGVVRGVLPSYEGSDDYMCGRFR